LVPIFVEDWRSVARWKEREEKRGGRMSGDGDEMRRSRSSRTAATTTGAMLVVVILLPQPQLDTPPSTSRLRVSYRFAAYSLATSLPQCPLYIPFQFVGRGKSPGKKHYTEPPGILTPDIHFVSTKICPTHFHFASRFVGGRNRGSIEPPGI